MPTQTEVDGRFVGAMISIATSDPSDECRRNYLFERRKAFGVSETGSNSGRTFSVI
jgi:hypothetical protein